MPPVASPSTSRQTQAETFLTRTTAFGVAAARLAPPRLSNPFPPGVTPVTTSKQARAPTSHKIAPHVFEKKKSTIWQRLRSGTMKSAAFRLYQRIDVSPCCCSLALSDTGELLAKSGTLKAWKRSRQATGYKTTLCAQVSNFFVHRTRRSADFRYQRQHHRFRERCFRACS